MDISACFVVMCGIKELDALQHALPEPDLAAALDWYLGLLKLHLAEFRGWSLISEDPLESDRTRLTFGFHQLADAAAWALRMQNVLLNASWPEVLHDVECCRTVYHKTEGGAWEKLFHGLRVAFAINKQVMSRAYVVVRCIGCFDMRVATTVRHVTMQCA